MLKVGLFVGLLLALFGYARSSALKVINGGEVPAHGVPYQAHIVLISDFGPSWNCTGVLYTSRDILTTSKCEWSGPTSAIIYLGLQNVMESESAPQVLNTREARRTAWKYYNDDFVYATLENNIGIVRLPREAKLNNDVQVAQLADTDDVGVGQTGTISGWGVNGAGSQSTLHSATVKVVDNSVCAKAYPNTYTGPKTICVKGEDGASACNGDGGAPLIIGGKVVGVYSGGPSYLGDPFSQGYNPADCSNQPNIFTKVASYKDWINENSY